MKSTPCTEHTPPYMHGFGSHVAFACVVDVVIVVTVEEVDVVVDVADSVAACHAYTISPEVQMLRNPSKTHPSPFSFSTDWQVSSPNAESCEHLKYTSGSGSTKSSSSSSSRLRSVPSVLLKIVVVVVLLVVDVVVVVVEVVVVVRMMPETCIPLLPLPTDGASPP